MKTLFLLVFSLLFVTACNNTQKFVHIDTSELKELEISQIDTDNFILTFYIVVENKENQIIKTDAMGVEVFANGLKIGENYCKLNTSLEKNSKQNIPVSIAFKISDLGIKEHSIPKNLQLNIQGQLKVIMNEEEFRTPIIVNMNYTK